MSDASVRPKTKHFWIKIMPQRGVDSAIVHGTLICEDGETQILHEAVDFISTNSKEFEMDWLVDILRPAGAPPICSAEPVTNFIKRQ